MREYRRATDWIAVLARSWRSRGFAARSKTAEAIALFRDRALPLYERNEPMLSFRGLREVESPEPLDLIVVSAFRGMAGMDESMMG